MSDKFSVPLESTDRHSRRRAIAILLNNYSLQQFLWYYATCPQEYDWDALILPYDLANSFSSVLYNNSQKANVFRKINIYNTNRNTFGLMKKIKVFAPLLTSYITGRKVQQCKKIILQAIGPIDYDLYIVFSDFGVLSGAIIACAKDRNVLVFEDGIGDYSARSSQFAWKMFSLNEIVGFVLAKMGYCNPAYRYINKPTTQCIKYCCYPEWMKYRDYADIRQLFSTKDCNEPLYKELLNKSFLSGVDLKSLECDVVLLGTVIADYSNNVKEYYQKVSDYLYAHHHNAKLLVKMHPREVYCHDWPELNHIIADNSVSADLLIPLLQDKKYFCMLPTTALLAIIANDCDCYIFHFPSLALESADYEEAFNEICENIGWPKDKIIQL